MTKNVLITGTSSGIGLEIEKVLLNKGYNVFGCGRRKLNKDNYFQIDLLEDNAVRTLYNVAKDKLENIDILINNAGEYIYSPLDELSDTQISNMVKLNFQIPMLLSKLVLGDMKKNRFGRIINIGSISGVVGEGNAAVYSATKSALSGFTKALALETAQDFITVNQINPGWVETPLANDNNNFKDVSKKELADLIPQKRFIEPVEIADLIVYLISDAAKGLTGQGINLCAGLSCGC